MKVAEIYQSVQGEGLLTGTPSAFIRASGCNLRCVFCDTPYASWAPEGEDLSVAEIADRVLALGGDHVVLTGGEPMVFAELIPLTAALARSGRHITVETAGTLFLPVWCDLMSISPKLSNSTPPVARAGAWRDRHERTRHAAEVIAQLVASYPHQIKFVVGSAGDVDEAIAYLEQFPQIDRSRVMFMPEGTVQQQLSTVAEWLEPLCAQHGVRFCPRRQIEWFGLVRGT